MVGSFRRRFLTVLILAPLLAVGVESLVWLVAARQVQAGFEAWCAARRAQGWQVRSGVERLGGWPLAAAVQIAGFAISGGKDLVPGGLAWRTERFALRLNLLSPATLILRPAGRERLRLAGSPEIALAATQMAVALPGAVSWGAPGGATTADVDTITIDATDVRIGAAALDPLLVTMRRLRIDAASGATAAAEAAGSADHGAPTDGMPTGAVATVRLEAAGVALADASPTGLGPEMARLSLTALLVGPVPAGPDWTTRLGAWRGRGGRLMISDLSLAWGPLAVGASGRLGLDQVLQPAGQGSARLVGYAAALDALAAAGRISRGAATAAKAVLMLLARPSTIGGPPEVDVPLRLEGRTLSVGEIPLIKVPAVTWPADP